MMVNRKSSLEIRRRVGGADAPVAAVAVDLAGESDVDGARAHDAVVAGSTCRADRRDALDSSIRAVSADMQIPVPRSSTGSDLLDLPLGIQMVIITVSVEFFLPS